MKSTFTLILTQGLLACLGTLYAASDSGRGTLSLDGDWAIAFDPEDKGLCQEWWRPSILEPIATRKIPVPSCWEEHEEDYEGVAWYTREFTMPAEWKDRYVRLRFDAVNYLAEVWLNGKMVGSEESGFTPVELNVTPFLKFGEPNVLTVRVVGAAVRSERSGQYVRNEVPAWRGACLGGIWQSVCLIATDPVFVKDIFVEPKIADGKAVVNFELENASFQPVPEVGAVPPVGKDKGPGLIPQPIRTREVTAEISIASCADPGKPVVLQSMVLAAPPGARGCTATLKIPEVRLWSPDQPHLYQATVRLLEDGRESDSGSARFGMREFTVRENDFYLNGERIYIKGAFWEGLYPATLGHPRDPEIVRKEIRMAKEAGFNLLRPWRMPPAPLILDLADEMGMLLVGSPAIACMGYWPAETPRMEEHWTRAFTEMIRRDRNHPSIVMWETTNEIVRESMLVRRHRVTLAGRAADPTRLIVDESGGARSVWGSFAYLPYSSEPLQFCDRHLYYRAPVDAPVYDSLKGFDAQDQLVFISEVGYGSFPDIAANVARYRKEGNPKTPDYKYHVELLKTLQAVMAKHKLGEIFADTKALCDSTQQIQALGNKLQLEALRLNPNADGYCIHAYTDGDWVVGAGVLDLWREPKKLYDTLKVVQAPLYLGIRVTPNNVYASEGARLTVTSANDGTAAKGELELRVTSGQGETVWSKKQPVSVPLRVQSLLEERLDTANLAGVYAVTARLLDGGSVLAENTFDFRVFPDASVAPEPGNIAVIDRQQALERYCKPRGLQCLTFQPGAAGPVLVAPNDASNEQQAAQFVQLIDWVERGGVAIWLDPPSTFENTGQPVYQDPEKNFMMRFQNPKRRPAGPWPNLLIQAGIFPKALRHRNATGGWIPVGHYARRHPIFAGAEVQGFMDWPWQNVAARKTLVNLDVPSIAGSVSWQAYHDYRAETKAWHGVDLGILPFGKGRMILSTLEILPHLGKDPLADKMLRNLLAFARQQQQAIDPPRGELAGKVERHVAEFTRLKADWNARLEAAAAEPWP